MNKTETLLSVLANPMQRLDNAMVQVRDGYNVDTAVGVQLDILGKLVGQKRGGLADVDYRRYIRARIAANKSAGKREELINIARLILGDSNGTVVCRGSTNATFILEIRDRATDNPTATALQELLDVAVANGVRIVVEWSAVSLAQTFRLDGGPGLDQGHLARGVDESGTV